LDGSSAAVAILVLEGSVNHVGEGFEAAVWVPGCAARLIRGVFNLAHLVHVDERV
jgi:hypothetical protein